MNSLIRSLRIWFRGQCCRQAASSTGFLDVCFIHSHLAARTLYAFQALVALTLLPNWEGLLAREGFVPLWPVVWMEWMPEPFARGLVLLLFFGGSLAAAVYPGPRCIRILAFLGLFGYMAWHNSFGKIGHGLHVLLFIQFLLIWLPGGWEGRGRSPDRRTKLATCYIYWAAQGIPLLAYTMAGLIKIGCGIWQTAAGQASVFGPEALPRHVADRLIQTGAEAPLAHWIIDFPWIFMGMMWITLYLEFFAFWALFRTALRKVFVVGLIAFHLGSFFTMGILFTHNMFLLILLFLVFPAHAKETGGLGEWVRQLPVLGRLPLIGRKKKKNSAKSV